MMNQLTAAVVILAVSLFPGHSAYSQDQSTEGTVRLSQGSVAVGVGYSWGGGTLDYHGKSYSLKVRGLSIGQAGISKAEARGKVQNLTRLEDFNGNYTSAWVE